MQAVEPQTIDRGAAICDQLVTVGVSHVAWLPDSETYFMHRALERESRLTTVQVCREGEAVGICAGLYLGGARGAMLVENQGLFDSGNVLKWAAAYRFPLIALVGYLMYAKMEETAGGLTLHGARDYTEPFMQAFEVPYCLVTRDEDVPKIGEIAAEAFERQVPAVALLSSARYYSPGT